MIKALKKNWLLLLILLISAFFRLYKISSYLTFLGDEGRDALVWLRMIRNQRFTLIGPQTSIGNMYLGPLYYYLMLPFYFILGTIGPSIGVALFGIATTFLLWLTGSEWFSQKVGLAAAFFYAISPVAIVYSKSSWNPNVMPFFALLTVFGIFRFWQKNQFIWLPLIGITLSSAIQSHYLGLLLMPLAGIFGFIKLKELSKKKDKHFKKFLLFFILSGLLFLFLTIAPLVWFDLRHGFINFKSFYKFFSERQSTVNFKIYKAFPNFWPLWQMLITRLLAGKNEIFGLILSVFAGISIGLFFFHKKPILFRKKALILLITWLIVGLLGMGLYKQHIYDHYFGFLFPAVFLLAGWLAFQPENFHHRWQITSLVLIFSIAFFSLKETPLKSQPNSQMARVQTVAEKIIQEAGDKPYNFALIAKQNYEAGYEYFLELWQKPSTPIDPQHYDLTAAEQLFVVCEDPVCEPTTNAKAGIANFGWSKVEKEWNFSWGVKLYKLVHLVE